jgi:hypothetical protein
VAAYVARCGAAPPRLPEGWVQEMENRWTHAGGNVRPKSGSQRREAEEVRFHFLKRSNTCDTAGELADLKQPPS